MPVIACDACGEGSVIRLQESHLCGRCLWAVSLLLRNRMPFVAPLPSSQASIEHAETVRQAIADVLHLRQRLATLESEIAP